MKESCTQTSYSYKYSKSFYKYCPIEGEHYLFSQREKLIFGDIDFSNFDIFYSIYFLTPKRDLGLLNFNFISSENLLPFKFSIYIEHQAAPAYKIKLSLIKNSQFRQRRGIVPVKFNLIGLKSSTYIMPLIVKTEFRTPVLPEGTELALTRFKGKNTLQSLINKALNHAKLQNFSFRLNTIPFESF